MDGPANALIGAASADVLGKHFVNLLVGWVWRVFEKGRCFQNHTALAKPTLGDVFFKPGFLAGMRVVFRESFDGGERLPGGILARNLAGTN